MMRPDLPSRTNPPRLHRRRFLGSLSAAGLGMLIPVGRAWAITQPRKFSIGEAFDAAVASFMTARQIPGGALAVVKEGRLVYASGYGWADRERHFPTKPDTLFRIASISKPFTAVTVLRLVEQGRLDLDTRVVERLEISPFLSRGRQPDPFLDKITVRHLLQHTGGWDRDKSFDPMFRSRWMANRMGIACPPGPRDIIRFMFGRPLDFEPGNAYAYSNFGYCVLGRLIEKVTGRGYEGFVREQVLAPLGIRRMRLGATLEANRAPGEAHYYTANDGKAESVFPGTPRKVPWPYGGFCLEAMDAHGGWIASVVDLARFAAALDTGKPVSLLKPETLAATTAPPPGPVSRRTDGTLQDHWYGCGWAVRPVGDGRINTWHTGSLPGTSSLLVRRWDGLSWAAVFNQRSEDKKLPDSEIDGALHRAANSVGDWPVEDWFREFAEPDNAPD